MESTTYKYSIYHPLLGLSFCGNFI